MALIQNRFCFFSGLGLILEVLNVAYNLQGSLGGYRVLVADVVGANGLDHFVPVHLMIKHMVA